mmetsp:Transcript_13669/g.34391  ORF Transcript_13669/g.34391 Transcript_13669/m.34391 type:complete len:475 (-) Transcript_13669:1619-3043(-)
MGLCFSGSPSDHHEDDVGEMAGDSPGHDKAKKKGSEGTSQHQMPHATAAEASAKANGEEPTRGGGEGSSSEGCSVPPRKPRAGLPNAKHFGLEGTHVVLDVLGTGGEGSAWLMHDIKANRLCAVKLIKRPVPRVLLPFLNQEITIQAQLGRQHENIIDLEGIILTPYFLAIVMEYAEGGPLTRYICKKAKKVQQQKQQQSRDVKLFIQEAEALYFFKQFISAVEFCHKHGFAHRDLKLDNTLLTGEATEDENAPPGRGTPPTIKISDFGFAKGCAEENTFTTIGTPCYMSPEVLNTRTTNEGYNAKRADVWACGVLLFAMLYGMFPFDSTDHDPNSITTVHDILEQQLATLADKSKAPLSLPGVDMALLSEECQDLLRKIFTLDPEKRVTIDEIRQHPWYVQPLPEVYSQKLKEIQRKQKERDEVYTRNRHYFPPEFKENLQELVTEASRPSPPQPQKGKASKNKSIWLSCDHA